MSRHSLAPRRIRQRGLSLVELMVGIVVSLLVGLAAAGSVQMFTASQRQGIGVGSTSANANSALASIKADLAQAGLGFFGDRSYLCPSLNLSVDAAAVSDGAAFAPIQMSRVNGFDTIDVVYGSQIESGANVLLNDASDGTSARTMSLLPAQVGQAVLLAPATPGAACTVRSITAQVAATATTPQLLTFGAAGTHNMVAFAAAPAYAARARIALLGTIQWNRYRVANGQLIIDQRLTGSSATLLRNVLAFRAEYGVSANVANSTTLESWQDASDAGWNTITAANIARVRALRIGIVTRSEQPEKPNDAGQCTASSAKPTLFGDTIEPDVANWTCYRYRVATAVVPMRNIVLGLKP